MFKRIGIIGSGALGSYYGARLAQGGREVHFHVRSDFEALGRRGMRIQSPDGDFQLSPEQLNLYQSTADMPQVDLVVVTLKTTANDQFEPLIAPLLHKGTAILTLQNGLGNDEALAALFGAERVLGGLAFICTNRIEPGVIRHTDYGFIKLGEFVPGPSERADALAALFRQSTVRCEALADIRHGRWEKLVWNVPFNGLGAALDLETDRLLASAAGRGLVRQLMHEVIVTAGVAGVKLPEEVVQKQIDRTGSMGAYMTSMQVDRRQQRPLEYEAIVSRPLAVARSGGAPVPVMEVLNQQLITIDSR